MNYWFHIFNDRNKFNECDKQIRVKRKTQGEFVKIASC